MCLAIPAKLIRCEGDDGVVDLHGMQLPVNLQLTPGVRPGQWLLIHAGFSIETIDRADAVKTFALVKDLQDASCAGNGVQP